tara:strand:- start:25203 stop:25700 length:498 start_codon:yes stop_codon:yes gene_type:complete
MGEVKKAPRRDIPFGGDENAEFRRRMMEHRRLRGLLTRAAGAARRRGDTAAAAQYNEIGRTKGVRVGGLDRTPRIRQQVLQEIAQDEQIAGKNQDEQARLAAGMGGRNRIPKIDPKAPGQGVAKKKNPIKVGVKPDDFGEDDVFNTGEPNTIDYNLYGLDDTPFK